ncbi:MAG: four helix bundle protein [Paludibacteraceae bacterium]|nr:four helix bundle protein [Paludibacteraceae bacterium]
MGKLSVFEDLPIWQEARLIAKDIYSITANDLFSKDFRFVSQIRSASGSIMDNIAEGFERDNNREFLHFLYIAKGSCGEVRSQLHRAFDVGYINNEVYKTYVDRVLSLNKSISKFIQYLKTSDLKGVKHVISEAERDVF